jgi:hypothetical protein
VVRHAHRSSGSSANRENDRDLQLRAFRTRPVNRQQDLRRPDCGATRATQLLSSIGLHWFTYVFLAIGDAVADLGAEPSRRSLMLLRLAQLDYGFFLSSTSVAHALR